MNYVNPFGFLSGEALFFKNKFLLFLSTYTSFATDKWSLAEIKYEQQPSNDGHNCGIYVLMYMDNYLSGTSLLKLKNPVEYRKLCITSIIENAVINACINCGSSKGKMKIQCITCKYYICKTCSKNQPEFQACVLCIRHLNK